MLNKLGANLCTILVPSLSCVEGSIKLTIRISIDN